MGTILIEQIANFELPLSSSHKATSGKLHQQRENKTELGVTMLVESLRKMSC